MIYPIPVPIPVSSGNSGPWTTGDTKLCLAVTIVMGVIWIFSTLLVIFQAYKAGYIMWDSIKIGVWPFDYEDDYLPPFLTGVISGVFYFIIATWIFTGAIISLLKIL